MSDIKYEIVGSDNKYKLQINKIYDQNVRSRGGHFTDFNIVSELNRLTELHGENVYIVCAVKEDKLVGFVQLLDSFIPDSLYLAVLAVDKECRGQGIGRGLVDFAMHHSIGYKTVSVETFSNNEIANELYKKLGFEFVLSYSIPGHLDGEQNYYRLSAKKIADNQRLRYSYKQDRLKDRRQVGRSGVLSELSQPASRQPKITLAHANSENMLHEDEFTSQR